MKKYILILPICFFTTLSFSQMLDSLQNKFISKVCDCVGQIDQYEQLRPRVNKCYDSTMNYIFNGASSEEVKFYTVAGNLKLLTQNFEQKLNTQCPTIKRVIEEYISTSSSSKSYPTNFNATILKEAKEHLNKWDGQIIAFDAEIIEIHSLGTNRPYLKVKLDDDNTIWIGSMTNSKLETMNNKLRFLGYFSLTGDGVQFQQFNKSGYHVLAFSVVELNSKEYVLFSGSQVQFKEWKDGKVPKAKK